MANRFEEVKCTRYGFGDLFSHCEVENLHWDHIPTFSDGGLFAELAHGAYAIYDGHTSRGWVLFGDKDYATAQWQRFKNKYKNAKNCYSINRELQDAFWSNMQELRNADR